MATLATEGPALVGEADVDREQDDSRSENPKKLFLRRSERSDGPADRGVSDIQMDSEVFFLHFVLDFVRGFVQNQPRSMTKLDNADRVPSRPAATPR